MTHRFSFIFFFCGAILLQPLYFSNAHGEDQRPEAMVETDGSTMPPPAAEKFITFSPPFDATPVALVDDEPITKYDLSVALAQKEEQASGHPGESEKEYLPTLNRLINSKLIVQEAKNIGLNETPEVQSQIKGFKRRQMQTALMGRHLQGLEPDPAEVKKMYHEISREVKLQNLIFSEGAGANWFLMEAKLKGANLDKLVKRSIAEKKAKERKDETYVKLTALRPEIAGEVFSMKVGGLSKIYRIEDGYLVYRLVDTRFVEDPAAREEAVRRVTTNTRSQKARDYSLALQNKYVTFNKDVFKQLDFDTDLKKLLQDKRILVKAKGKNDSFSITVADLAAEMEKNFFHGADKAAKLKLINIRKEVIIQNRIFNYTSELEARHLGLDQTKEFKRKVADFEISTLFQAFMKKLILPKVKITEEELLTYYNEHIEEYSSPALLRMKSLVFKNRLDAESALDKLRKGADYNWVSANTANLIDPNTPGVLPLDKDLLSLTSLPEDLQKLAGEVKKNDLLLYAPSTGDMYYALMVEEVFPPKPQPFADAKAEVRKKVFQLNTEKLLNEWIAKLKAVYPVQIFLRDPGQ
jgi:hypothetical protein